MKISRWIAAGPVVAGFALSLLMLPAIAAAGYDTYEEAFATAKAEGKPLLIDFFTTWCGPCKVFNKASVEDVDVRTSLESFVLFKIDAEKGAGIDLAAKHNVKSYPTYLVLNADETPIGRWSGYEKAMFLTEAGNTITDPTTAEEKIARFAVKPTLDDAVTLARYHSSNNEYGKSISLYETAAEMDPDNDYGIDIALDAYSGHRRKQFTDEELESRILTFMKAENSKPSDILSMARLMSSAFRANPEKTAAFLELAVTRTEGLDDPAVAAARARVMPDYALHVLKDGAKAVEYKKASYPEGWQEDPSSLNGFAWWCFENDLNLEEAQDMAMKGVSLAEAGGDRGQILDTLAEICNAMGNCGEALEYMLQARDEDPESEYYKKQVERFEKILAEKEQG